MHYILCKNDSWTKTLSKEIGADFTKSFEIIEGLPLIKITEDVDLKDSFIAFSTTALINAHEIDEASVSVQAGQILEYILPKIEPNCEINFHTFGITHKYGILETGRAEILKGKILPALRKKGIKPFKLGFNRNIGFLQIFTLADRSVVISYLNKEEMPRYHSLISPFVGGHNNIEDDIRAPSRAFKKISEAQEILGVKISSQELVVDLGACPGGWSYIARKNGARVVAIDRSPLVKELMSDKNVAFVKADAFKYESNELVDWVVSDIICAPERILELMSSWVQNNKCINFIFTIKFQGQRDYGALKKFKTAALKCDYKIIIKQLNANKNEVTIMGSSSKT